MGRWRSSRTAGIHLEDVVPLRGREGGLDKRHSNNKVSDNCGLVVRRHRP